MSSYDSAANAGRRGAAGQVPDLNDIAHLFFDDGNAVGSSARREAEVRLMVTCFNDSRIAAVAMAAMVDRALQLDAGERAFAIRLLEEPGLRWSARSFLQAPVVGREPGLAGRGGQWRWGPADAATPVRSAIAWALLHESHCERSGVVGGLLVNRPAPSTACHALVVCLLAREVGRLDGAIRLGRLLGQLEPTRLELVVFPDDWAPARPARQWPLLRRRGGKHSAADLMERCHELTRAVAGRAPLTITNLTGPEPEARDDGFAAILGSLGERLVTEFSVDRDI